MSLLANFQQARKRTGDTGIAYLGEEAYAELKTDPECQAHWRTDSRGHEYLCGYRVIQVHPSTEAYRKPRPARNKETY